MPDSFSDEQWAHILQIARAALDLPMEERPGFIHDSTRDPAIACEAIKVADELEDPPEDEPDRLRTSVGRFLLLDYLGSGSAGEVYSARDPDLRRIVAIKLLRPEPYRLRDSENRFMREARAASALNHPNIVTVHQIVRTEENLAIIMELVPGESLREKCGSPVPMDGLVNMARQIAEGLAAAHAAGVVHRDLKPENVMVMPDGRIKVLDFGLAQSPAFGELTKANLHRRWAGTPRYMSPEQVRGQKLTSASDVFALGIVLYEMATGQHPFLKDSPLDLFHSIAHEEPFPPAHLNPAIPPRVNSLIVAMMHKDGKARPGAALVAEELRRSVSQTNLVNSVLPRFGVLLPRRKLLLAGAILLIVALAASTWKISSSSAGFSGPEQITSFVPENHATAAAISGNGKLLAYANVDGIFVRTLGTEDATSLNGPVNFAADHLAWLPNDTGIVASGLSGDTHRPAIWSLPLAGGVARQLRLGGRLANPSADGSRIAFLQDDYRAIWTMASDGGNQKRLIDSPENDFFARVLWSGDDHTLIIQRRKHQGPPEPGRVMFNSRYLPVLETVSSETGETRDQLPDFSVQSAASLPNGQLLFVGGLKPESDATLRLWSTSIDPASARFSRRYKDISAGVDLVEESLDLSVTRDGSAVALIRQATRESLFVADFFQSPPRLDNAQELTLNGKASYPHAWTADSQSVIFESDRSGGYDLFLQRLGDRLPQPIVITPKRWEVFPQLTPDGQMILYLAGPPEGGSSSYTLMRVPVRGGTISEVPGGEALEGVRCSIGGKGRCVTRTFVAHEAFAFSEVDAVRGVGPELARTAWFPTFLGDWDISPDGTVIALPDHDLRAARIRLVTLDRATAARAERELDLPELAHLSSLAWAADGSGWFVSVDSFSSTGRQLYFSSLDGKLAFLGTINGWVVPAPDGRKVAYLDRIYDANVWMMWRK